MGWRAKHVRYVRYLQTSTLGYVKHSMRCPTLIVMYFRLWARVSLLTSQSRNVRGATHRLWARVSLLTSQSRNVRGARHRATYVFRVASLLTVFVYILVPGKPYLVPGTIAFSFFLFVPDLPCLLFHTPELFYLI